MPKITFDIKGDKKLLKALDKLPKLVARKVIRQALRTGAKPILASAKAHVPIKTGKLKESLKIRVAKVRKPKTSYGLRVQTAQGDFKGETFYGAFIEYGTKKMPAKPYMRPAYDTLKEPVTDLIRVEIAEGIERAAKEVR